MADGPLTGVGVLVTRPAAQATELVHAIENCGGRAITFPAIEIVALDQEIVAAAAGDLPKPDIAVFVSRNAVEHGLRYAVDAQVAAIGPATAAALEAAGRAPDIVPATGFDSESLLEEAAFTDVRGKHLLIVRGKDGREYLGDELRARGAVVSYLAVYDRIPASPDAESLASIEAEWRAGNVNVVTIMSVATLANLAEILPDWCAEQLADTPLVTPAERVIKEALKRFPASHPVLASGTEAKAIVEAAIATQNIGQTP